MAALRGARRYVVTAARPGTGAFMNARTGGAQAIHVGHQSAVVYEQEGKQADFFLKDDVDKYFNLPNKLPLLAIKEHPLPESMIDEMWKYTDWHACFRGKVERKEEAGRRTEFVQFLFDRLGERYKFLCKSNVALRSRHSWGQVACTLSYPRGHFGVVHFITDFNKWHTTDGIGQYPKIWPKPHRSVLLYLDMAAHENYRIGMGPPRWGVVTDGLSWKVIEQCASDVGAWDGRQTFKESATFQVTLPLTREGYDRLTAWLNGIFLDHAPIDTASRHAQFKAARKAQGELPDAERHAELQKALAGLDDI
eukprot:TRINITY_DN22786_c0_g1_i1.p1 TRINITY_DN22786_c0_g1~~TRINITY_DN22786_c0_g1_i1.p1  ORF type:complete len:323 (+),score=97.43 TRINITY_DN22786_c0_g1_i1:46-969(+)